MRADSVGAPVTPQQWDYIHEMGGALRSSLDNVTAVFAPSCIGHAVLTKRDWLNIKIDDISLVDALRCWERSTHKHKGKDKGLARRNSDGSQKNRRERIQLTNGNALSGNNSTTATAVHRQRHRLTKEERMRRRQNMTEEERERRRLNRIRKNQQQNGRNMNQSSGDGRRRNMQNKNANRMQEKPKANNARQLNGKQNQQNNRNNRKRRRNRNNENGGRKVTHRKKFAEPKRCSLRLLERCSWPQCNHSCPALTNPLTGEEMRFLELLTSFGLDIEAVATALGIDMQTLNNMDHAELVNLLTQQVS